MNTQDEDKSESKQEEQKTEEATVRIVIPQEMSSIKGSQPKSNPPKE